MHVSTGSTRRPINELIVNAPVSTRPPLRFSTQDETKKKKKGGRKETNGSDCRKEILQIGDRVAVRVMLQAVLAVGIRENECQEGGRAVLGVLFIPRPPHVPALVAVKDVRNVGLLDLGAGQVHPDAALVALDHRPPGERLPAVAGDQVPRIVSCDAKKEKKEKRCEMGGDISSCVKRSSTRRTRLHHDVFVGDPGLPLTGAHLRVPDGLLLRRLPQGRPAAAARVPVHRQLLSDRSHLPVPALGVRLALSGAFEFLSFGLFGVFAAFDTSPFLALAAAAVRRRYGGTQRQLFQLFVLLALRLRASRALVQGVFKAHLVQQSAIGVHAANAFALVRSGFPDKRVDGVNV